MCTKLGHKWLCGSLPTEQELSLNGLSYKFHTEMKPISTDLQNNIPVTNVRNVLVDGLPTRLQPAQH